MQRQVIWFVPRVRFIAIFNCKNLHKNVAKLPHFLINFYTSNSDLFGK
jgi:hypothetical protein